MGRKMTAALAALAFAGMSAGPAEAARRPTAREAKAIKAAALKACVAPPGERCRWHRARVSTRDSRYAWANVTAEGTSGMLLKRTSGRFRVLATQGGGVEACKRWLRHAPARVLDDLRVRGLDADGRYGRCR
ncbi:MAG TPA: hypothetical protein VNS09_19780 [Solirubrobacter sp.]|nr:hypothetical protein [Solirubrobacter sp.]